MSGLRVDLSRADEPWFTRIEPIQDAKLTDTPEKAPHEVRSWLTSYLGVMGRREKQLLVELGVAAPRLG